MSKKANKTIIGVFVVGAIVLITAAILILGSGKFFRDRETFVMVFEGSVKGLSVGAPVTFRGVKIGSVSDIAMLFDANDMTFLIAVYVQLGEGKTRPMGEDVALLERSRKRADSAIIRILIDKGMKAQLQTQSYLTGQLEVALDFYPDKPVKLTSVDPEYLEIPTIPMPLQEIGKKLQDLPIDELAERLLSSLEGIDNLVNSPELRESISHLNQALDDMQKLVRNVDSRIQPLASSVQGTVNDFGTLARNANSKIEPLASSADEAIKAITAAAKQADKTLVEVRGLVGEDSPATSELTRTLKELSAAARSIRVWAEYLERHPEALIRGKGEYRR
jgi:paraquat-inducible protein B